MIYENFAGHKFETQVHIQTQIRLNPIFTLATKHLMIINKDNLYLHLKAFEKHLVSSCCVTSFFRRWPVNPTFLTLPFFT